MQIKTTTKTSINLRLIILIFRIFVKKYVIIDIYIMKKINLEKIKFTSKLYNNEILTGLQFFFDAHNFILKNNFIKYLLISGLIFIAFFSISLKALMYGIDSLEPIATNWIINNFMSYINLSIDNVKTGIHASFWLLKTTIESNQDRIFTMIFMIIGSFYFSYITGKIHNIVFGKNDSQSSFKDEIIRGLKLSSINSIKQLGLFLVITLFSYIPILGIASPLLSFITQAYFNGILMADYALEKEGLDVISSKEFYKSNKPALFAIGLGFMFLLLIPVIGWFLAPTYSLIASVLYLKNK